MKKSIYYWRSILLFTFTIPLSQFLSVRLLLFILIFSLFIKKRSQFFIRSWDVIVYLLVLIAGLAYSSNLQDGFRTFETGFSLLALPIAFNKIEDFNKEKFQSLFIAFASGLLLTCLICLAFSVFQFNQDRNSDVFFYQHFTEIIKFHPTYITYYICLSLTVGFYFLYYEKIKIKALPLFLLFFFLISLLTAGRTAYISMLFVFSFFILKFLFDGDIILNKMIAFGFAILFIVAMLAVSYFNSNVASNATANEGDYWERLSLWKSAIDANPNFLFGVGTGDYKTVMNEYYRTHNLSQFASDSFNAHNQFLQTYFSNGLIGLIAVVMLIIRPLYLSVKYQNVLGILVFFSFIIYGMTEVFLGRYQGVVFFALLHQVFIHFYYSRQSSFSLKEI